MVIFVIDDSISILELLRSGKILVSDGAMGTMLQDMGLQPGECPEAWNLSQPETVGLISKQYTDAGADIVHTNTFGASPIKLAGFGLEKEIREINSAAVDVARVQIGNSAFISGSMGPTGQLPLPYGTISLKDMKAAFAAQSQALIMAGVDMLSIETMTSLQEAVSALEGAREIDHNIPISVSMTFNRTPNGYVTIMGESINNSVKALHDAGANIVGSNCGNGLDTMIEIASEFRKATSSLVIIQSNAGLPEVIDGSTIYPESPVYFSKRVELLLDLNISIIGGCCGTTAKHIHGIKKAVDSTLTQ